MKANPDAKFVAFVHAETSTGALSDAKTICEIAKKYNCLTIVDAVTSLAGSELRVDAWGIDAIYSGTQKCLCDISCLSPVSFSERAVGLISSRKTKVQSWFLDMNLVMGYWGGGVKRAYHHTAQSTHCTHYMNHWCLLKKKAWRMPGKTCFPSQSTRSGNGGDGFEICCARR